ncbi:hypothetical protein [Streptomyces liangshanensis]
MSPSTFSTMPDVGYTTDLVLWVATNCNDIAWRTARKSLRP